MASMLSIRRPTNSPAGGEIGLAWLITKTADGELVYHNGGTGGYRSFIGYDAKTRAGVVVLSNTFTGAGIDDIGMHLLDLHAPLLPAPKEHKEITVDPKIFDGYVGRYQLAPSFILTVTREGDKLFVQATNQPKFEIFPEGVREYFLKVVDAQITFVTDAGGRASELILHQGGRDQHAKRLEGEAQ
jgi:CubicO group peptidase (beta-lactamase class C family)